jgi:hypothetical protein
MPFNYIIEGLDRLGKSSLIEGIQHKEGFHTVIHYSKPKRLDSYVQIKEEDGLEQSPEFLYQYDGFVAMFELLGAGMETPLIFDRAHLGECVYAPMYRGYDGSYVFGLEEIYGVEEDIDTRLILLVEDFSKSKHFVDDGLSLGSVEKRAQEQLLFIDAFNRSAFPDKKIICVTAEDGSFRSKEDILAEATAD